MMSNAATEAGLGPAIQIDEAKIRGHVEQRVRQSVEQTLNQLLDAEADALAETLRYMAFPREHWTRIRTNNPLERIMREIRRRTRVVGAFPDGQSALMLSAARLRHVAGTRWGTRKYLEPQRLAEQTLNQNASQSA